LVIDRVAEPDDEVDRAGVTAFRANSFFQPALLPKLALRRRGLNPNE